MLLPLSGKEKPDDKKHNRKTYSKNYMKPVKSTRRYNTANNKSCIGKLHHIIRKLCYVASLFISHIQYNT